MAGPPMTGRPAITPANPPPSWPTHAFVPPEPHRRWARVLRACADAPLTVGQLHRAVRRRGPGAGNAVREKLKTLRTLRTLTTHHLLAHTQGGLIATTLGLATLARAEAEAGWFDSWKDRP